MPMKPEMMEDTAPTKKATVENIPLYRAGLRPSGPVSVEKPSWELSSTKMTTEKRACRWIHLIPPV